MVILLVQCDSALFVDANMANKLIQTYIQGVAIMMVNGGSSAELAGVFWNLMNYRCRYCSVGSSN